MLVPLTQNPAGNRRIAFSGLNGPSFTRGAQIQVIYTVDTKHVSVEDAEDQIWKSLKVIKGLWDKNLDLSTTWIYFLSWVSIFSHHLSSQQTNQRRNLPTVTVCKIKPKLTALNWFTGRNVQYCIYTVKENHLQGWKTGGRCRKWGSQGNKASEEKFFKFALCFCSCDRH